MIRLPAIALLAVLSACAREQPAAPLTPPASTLDVVELTALDARDRMTAGTLTSHALTQAYLDRIATIDDAGPALGAVIELNPTALADADALDAERKAGKVRGPLHGIPVLLKDNIDAVGMVNSAGSLALAENRPKQDAFIVDAAARCRRGDSRQGEPERMGELPLDTIDIGLELAGRPDKEPVRARSESMRVELGDRHRDRRQPCRHRSRH